MNVRAESMIKAIKWLAAACLLAGAAAPVVAQSPTQDDIRRFQRLTPEQRATILKTVDQQQQNKVEEQPLEAPQLIIPLEPRDDRRSGGAADDRRRGSTADVPRNGDRQFGDGLYEDRLYKGRLYKDGFYKDGFYDDGRDAAEDDRGGADRDRADDRFGPIEDGELREEPGVVEKEWATKLATPLEYFGYDLFAGVPTTFAPATDIPMDADYVVGPGAVSYTHLTLPTS